MARAQPWHRASPEAAHHAAWEPLPEAWGDTAQASAWSRFLSSRIPAFCVHVPALWSLARLAVSPGRAVPSSHAISHPVGQPGLEDTSVSPGWHGAAGEQHAVGRARPDPGPAPSAAALQSHPHLRAVCSAAPWPPPWSPPAEQSLLRDTLPEPELELGLPPPLACREPPESPAAPGEGNPSPSPRRVLQHPALPPAQLLLLHVGSRALPTSLSSYIKGLKFNMNFKRGTTGWSRTAGSVPGAEQRHPWPCPGSAKTWHCGTRRPAPYRLAHGHVCIEPEQSTRAPWAPWRPVSPRQVNCAVGSLSHDSA